jgi:thiol-disulfide isomerase/thioredoxin
MSTSTRVTVAVLAAVVTIVVALVVRLGDDGPVGRSAPWAARDHRDADTAAALAGPRQRAGLAACPRGVAAAEGSALRSVTVECAGDGSAVDAGEAFSGRATLLNLWAYWCGPCRDELPAMAEYQRRVGSRLTVVTVHQDENETAALLLLADLGVRLPTLQDGRRSIATALRVPNVMPTTVALRADGSVAAILPRTFADADEIAAAVNPTLGVPG